MALLFEYALTHFSRLVTENQSANVTENESVSVFVSVCHRLRALRWLCVFEHSFVAVGFAHIENELQRRYCARKSPTLIDRTVFTTPMLKPLRKWAERTVGRWFKLILQNDDDNEDEDDDDDVDMRTANDFVTPSKPKPNVRRRGRGVSNSSVRGLNVCARRSSVLCISVWARCERR